MVELSGASKVANATVARTQRSDLPARGPSSPPAGWSEITVCGEPSTAVVASDQLMVDRVPDRGRPRGDAELAVDRAQVRVDRPRADDQPLGDLRVGQPLGDQAQHLDLAPGQAHRTAGGRRG